MTKFLKFALIAVALGLPLGTPAVHADSLELNNLKSDRAELTNLYSEHPDITQGLENRLSEWIQKEESKAK